MKKLKIKLPIIVLLGPPGSGKGTQAQLLAEKLNLYYFETSKIGEARIKTAKKGEYLTVDRKKYYFADEKKLWLSGKLYSAPFITVLVKEKIEELSKEGKGIIFAGSPRTLYEGEQIIPFVGKLYGKENIKVVLLKLSEQSTIWRNSHRKICELMRHTILYTKETAHLKLCPFDGSKLLRRKGLDDPKVIKVRLKEYKERTFPLVELFKKQGLKVKEVDGEPAVAQVFANILKKLKT